MIHFVLCEIYGTHFPHQLNTPLSDLTQEHFPALEVLLCWEYLVSNHVMEHLASLAEWQGTKGRKEPQISLLRMPSAHPRDGKRKESQELVGMISH